MKKVLIFGLALLLGSIILSCNQDSIFFALYNEPPPKDSFIGGTPANLVFVDDGVNVKRIYTGTRMSNKIYYYENSNWNRTPIYLPNGYTLGEAASAGGKLYILAFAGGDPYKSSDIFCYDPDPDNENWGVPI